MQWKLEHSYADLPQLFYREQAPVPVAQPQITQLNHPLAAELGLNPELLQQEEGVRTLAGNQLPQGAWPLAQAYAGHQFGHFTMLGDGRAVLLGEQITPAGKRLDIQLKGSGRTPFSRGGDGRAALGPMLREYVISEAMHHLGIPTTRSLAVTATGEEVLRETALPGAVLTRVASSHIRVGTFQYAAQWGGPKQVQRLADYALQRHYPDFENSQNRYLYLLQQVIRKQAALIAQWQRVGFIHGVMNTDNMAISGETIDYGPCAFMDAYAADTVFSSIDAQGRYAYRNQPPIAAWNLARFAETLLPLLNDDEQQAIKLAEAAVAEFAGLYETHWLNGMRAKLGIEGEEAEDRELIEDLLRMMEKHQADFTNTFLALTFDRSEEINMHGSIEFANWQERWQSRLNRQTLSKSDARERMKNHNPAVIPRNHRVEEALQAAVEGNDLSVLKRLLVILEQPYAHLPEQAEYARLPEPSGLPYRTYCGT